MSRVQSKQTCKHQWVESTFDITRCLWCHEPKPETAVKRIKPAKTIKPKDSIDS